MGHTYQLLFSCIGSKVTVGKKVNAFTANKNVKCKTCSGVDCINIDDWHRLKQNLGAAFYQFTSPSVQTCPFEEKTMYVDTLRRGVMDIFLGKSGHQALESTTK